MNLGTFRVHELNGMFFVLFIFSVTLNCNDPV